MIAAAAIVGIFMGLEDRSSYQIIGLPGTAIIDQMLQGEVYRYMSSAPSPEAEVLPGGECGDDRCRSAKIPIGLKAIAQGSTRVVKRVLSKRNNS